MYGCFKQHGAVDVSENDGGGRIVTIYPEIEEREIRFGCWRKDEMIESVGFRKICEEGRLSNRDDR